MSDSSNSPSGTYCNAVAISSCAREARSARAVSFTTLRSRTSMHSHNALRTAARCTASPVRLAEGDEFNRVNRRGRLRLERGDLRAELVTLRAPLLLGDLISLIPLTDPHELALGVG